MPEWTTDLRKAEPGRLVSVDVVRVVAFSTVAVVKSGTVLRCDELTMLIEIEGDERWRVGYSDKGVRVRAPESEARS